jgi:hypothetical protein
MLICDLGVLINCTLMVIEAVRSLTKVEARLPPHSLILMAVN